MNGQLKFYDVFVPGGYPQYTYNPRQVLNLEPQVGEVKENLCKLVVVTGHTKSGKTVLVRKVLPREEAIWIDGGSVGSEEDFWDSVVNTLDLFQTTEVEDGAESSQKFEGVTSVEASAVLVKGKTEVVGSNEEKKLKTTIGARTVSSRVSALDGLRKTKRAIVIDDFHYLSRELQGDIVRALKPLIFEGVPVVIIAIPHRRYDSLKVEKEMTSRIRPVDIPLWSEEELIYIPTKGFELLATMLSEEVMAELASQSLGSPHLMQEFCRAICRRYPTSQEQASLDVAALPEVFKETANSIGRPIFEKLAKGPRQRSDRIERKLKDGKKVDIYQLLLYALAHIKPALITLEYEDLRTTIKEICAEGVPQIHEVARVLKHMSEIASTDESSTPVINFDENEKRLHVTDPFFAFYLRWGDIGD